MKQFLVYLYRKVIAILYCHFGKVTTVFHKNWVFQSFKYGLFCLKDPRTPIYKWVLQEASCKRATLMPSILKVKIQSHLVWLCWGKISHLSKFFGNSVFHDFVYRQINSFQVNWTSLKKKEKFLIAQNCFMFLLKKSVFHKSVSRQIESFQVDWKISQHPKFFKLLFGKKSVLHESVSRQIKSFWVDWTPLWKIINFEHFSPPKIFSSFFEKKPYFSWQCFWANLVILNRLGPPLKIVKFETFLITQKIFPSFFGKNSIFHNSVSGQIKSFWIDWAPFEKLWNFEHFSSPKNF